MAMTVQVEVSIPNVAFEVVALSDAGGGVWSVAGHPLTRTCPVPGCGQVHLPPISITYTPDHADWRNDTLTIAFRGSTVGPFGLAVPDVHVSDLVSQVVDEEAGTQVRSVRWFNLFLPGSHSLFGSLMVFVAVDMPIQLAVKITALRQFSFVVPASNKSIGIFEDLGAFVPGERIGGGVTDADGRFVFNGFGPRRTFLVLVRGTLYRIDAVPEFEFDPVPTLIPVTTDQEDLTASVAPWSPPPGPPLPAELAPGVSIILP